MGNDKNQQKNLALGLQIGTNNSDINFTRAINIATDFEKIQFTPSVEEEGVFDFNNSNEDSTFEIKSRPTQLKLGINSRFNNASVN